MNRRSFLRNTFAGAMSAWAAAYCPWLETDPAAPTDGRLLHLLHLHGSSRENFERQVGWPWECETKVRFVYQHLTPDASPS